MATSDIVAGQIAGLLLVVLMLEEIGGGHARSMTSSSLPTLQSSTDEDAGLDVILSAEGARVYWTLEFLETSGAHRNVLLFYPSIRRHSVTL